MASSSNNNNNAAPRSSASPPSSLGGAGDVNAILRRLQEVPNEIYLQILEKAATQHNPIVVDYFWHPLNPSNALPLPPPGINADDFQRACYRVCLFSLPISFGVSEQHHPTGTDTARDPAPPGSRLFSATTVPPLALSQVSHISLIPIRDWQSIRHPNNAHLRVAHEVLPPGSQFSFPALPNEDTHRFSLLPTFDHLQLRQFTNLKRLSFDMEDHEIYKSLKDRHVFIDLPRLRAIELDFRCLNHTPIPGYHESNQPYPPRRQILSHNLDFIPPIKLSDRASLREAFIRHFGTIRSNTEVYAKFPPAPKLVGVTAYPPWFWDELFKGLEKYFEILDRHGFYLSYCWLEDPLKCRSWLTERVRFPWPPGYTSMDASEPGW